MNATTDTGKLEREVALRLWHDEDTGEITKSLGVTPEQVGRVRDTLPGMEEMIQWAYTRGGSTVAKERRSTRPS